VKLWWKDFRLFNNAAIKRSGYFRVEYYEGTIAFCALEMAGEGAVGLILGHYRPGGTEENN
jgi:hypothetical protein